jgi:hypothetical protein
MRLIWILRCVVAAVGRGRAERGWTWTSDALAFKLQVGARDGLYRPGLTEFVVTQDTRAAFGIVRQNPQFGRGGLPQIYIDNFASVTKPVLSYPLANRTLR